MDTKEYERMYRLENFYWWFQGRKNIVLRLVKNYFKDKKIHNILDAGCGTGMIFSNLEKFGTVIGIDLSEEALKFCKERRLRPLINADLTSLPFQDESFDLAVALDILEHVPEHEKAMAEFYRTVVKGGKLIITVPAHPFIWSEHDIALHHVRRYTMKTFNELIATQKWKKLKISYAISFTFPGIVLFRILGKFFKKKKETASTDLIILPKAINSFLTFLIRIESRMMQYINIPFGVTIVAVLEK